MIENNTKEVLFSFIFPIVKIMLEKKSLVSSLKPDPVVSIIQYLFCWAYILNCFKSVWWQNNGSIRTQGKNGVTFLIWNLTLALQTDNFLGVVLGSTSKGHRTLCTWIYYKGLWCGPLRILIFKKKKKITCLRKRFPIDIILYLKAIS